MFSEKQVASGFKRKVQRLRRLRQKISFERRVEVSVPGNFGEHVQGISPIGGSLSGLRTDDEGVPRFGRRKIIVNL